MYKVYVLPTVKGFQPQLNQRECNCQSGSWMPRQESFLNTNISWLSFPQSLGVSAHISLFWGWYCATFKVKIVSCWTFIDCSCYFVMLWPRNWWKMNLIDKYSSCRVKELSPHDGGGETQNQMETEETETSTEGSGLQLNVCGCSGLNWTQSWEQFVILTWTVSCSSPRMKRKNSLPTCSAIERLWLKLVNWRRRL